VNKILTRAPAKNAPVITVADIRASGCAPFNTEVANANKKSPALKNKSAANREGYASLLYFHEARIAAGVNPSLIPCPGGFTSVRQGLRRRSSY